MSSEVREAGHRRPFSASVNDSNTYDYGKIFDENEQGPPAVPTSPPPLVRRLLANSPVDAVTARDVRRVYEKLRQRDGDRGRSGCEDMKPCTSSAPSPIPLAAGAGGAILARMNEVGEPHHDSPMTCRSKRIRLGHGGTPTVPPALLCTTSPGGTRHRRDDALDSTVTGSTMAVVTSAPRPVSCSSSGKSGDGVATCKLQENSIPQLEPEAIKLGAGLGGWTDKTVAVSRLIDQDSRRVAEAIAGTTRKERHIKRSLLRKIGDTVKTLPMSVLKDNGYTREAQRSGLESIIKVMKRLSAKMLASSWNV